MSSRRLLKAAEAIRSVVGMSILADLKDPRIRDVTVTHVEVAPDMRNAKVYVSIMGDETRQNLSLRGLQSAAGFLQSKIAQQIDTRYTPRLQFVLDQGIKKSIEMARILREVLPPTSGDQLPDAESTETPQLQTDPDFAPYSEAEDSNDDSSEENPGEDHGSNRPR